MFLNGTPIKRQRFGFTLIEVMISFGIFTIVISGLIFGYTQVNRMAEFSSMSLAAQSFASQGLEEARSVQWCYTRWPNTNATAADPFWTAGGYTNLPAQVDTLDIPTTGTPFYVTNFVSITDITNQSLTGANTPLRQICSYCVWSYPWDGNLCTNTAIALRAPDQ
jgi:type II secretory pathway pseudopilin PulG